MISYFFLASISHILLNKVDATWINQMRLKFDRHNDVFEIRELKAVEALHPFLSRKRGE